MIEKFKNKYRTDSVRLKHWDYSWSGYYFITICVKNHECVFGDVVDKKMKLNELGKKVDRFWKEIPDHFNNAELDEFVVMPNHMHGILVLNNKKLLETQHCCVSMENKTSNTFYCLKSKSLPVLIRSFKSICTRAINKKRPYLGFQGQPKYYDHIICNERALENIQNYIRFNPQKWETNDVNPLNLK